MPANYQDGKATEDVRRASDGEGHSSVETKARNCQQLLALETKFINRNPLTDNREEVGDRSRDVIAVKNCTKEPSLRIA